MKHVEPAHVGVPYHAALARELTKQEAKAHGREIRITDNWSCAQLLCGHQSDSVPSRLERGWPLAWAWCRILSLKPGPSVRRLRKRVGTASDSDSGYSETTIPHGPRTASLAGRVQPVLGNNRPACQTFTTSHVFPCGTPQRK